MKTVLIGSDFVYDTTGKLIPIELNTNVGWDTVTPESKDSIFDFTELNNLVIENEINEITYIGQIELINTKLLTFCNDKNLVYNYIKLGGSDMIPVIDDTDQHLIIRSAYDFNAIVDSVYCRDKSNFLELIKSNTFGSQFAYHDGTTLINNITTIPDNENHPNFILKSVLPLYDKDRYPKLFKVTTEAELEVVLQNVTSEYFLMEYHINVSKLYLEHIQVKRSFNLLFPPNLESISIGSYTRLTTKKLNGLATFDATTFELTSTDTARYITSSPDLNSAKLGSTDLVEMEDESFKTGDELLVDDMVKTIIIPNPYNVDLENDVVSFGIPWDVFVNETTYSSDAVTSKREVSALVNRVRILFTDGSFWSDVDSSNYLVLRDNIVRFVQLYTTTSPDDSLVVGDVMILLKHENDELTPKQKTVSDIILNAEFFTGYSIEIEHTHVFLSCADEDESYVGIEHNGRCVDDDDCDKTYICDARGICIPGT